MIINLHDLVSQPFIQAISSTILHSIWQVPLIALVMAVIFRQKKTRSAAYRYNLSFASLLLVLITAIFTFVFYLFAGTQSDLSQSAGSVPITHQLPQMLNPAMSSKQTMMDLVEGNIFRIAWTWIIGVILFSTRLFAGGIYLHRLKRRLDYDVPESIQSLVKEITEKFSIKKEWQLALTDRIDIPVLIGYLKPVIVLPLAAVNRLSISEVETILAHEIAHLVRNDFIQNIVVLGIENIFFYHPVVWWMSSVLKTERENCCDDMVIRYYPDKIKYAKSLVKLQEIGQNRPPNIAMSLFNNKKSLMKRIKRILDQSYTTNPVREKVLATSLFIFAVISLGSAHQFVYPKESTNPTLLNPPLIEVEHSLGQEAASMENHNSTPLALPAQNPVKPSNITRQSGHQPSLDGKFKATPKASFQPAGDNNFSELTSIQNLDEEMLPTHSYTPFIPVAPVILKDTIDDEEYMRQREIVREKVREFRDKARAYAKEMRENARVLKELNRENLEAERAELRVERERLEDLRHKLSKEQRKEIKEMKELKDLEKSKFRKNKNKRKKFKPNRDDHDDAADFEAFSRDLEEELANLLDTDWVNNLSDIQRERGSDIMAGIDENLGEELAAFRAEMGDVYDEDWSKDMAKMSEELEASVSGWKAEMELSDASEVYLDLAASRSNHNSGLKTALMQALLSDGLLREKGKNKMSLTNDTLKVNGKSQPAALSEKYRMIVSEFVQDAFSGKTTIELKMDGKEPQNSEKTVLSITIEK